MLSMIPSKLELNTYSPEVVHKNVKDAKNNNQERSAVLGLESNNHHDTSNGSQDAHQDTPQGPLAAEDEAHKEEDQQHTASQLEVHLAVLLIDLGQTSKSLGLANPRIRQDHKQTTDNGQVSEEEVEIEDQAVAEGLRDHNPHQPSNCVIRVFPNNNERGTREHGDHVGDQENVRDSARNCQLSDLTSLPFGGGTAYCVGNREGRGAGRSTG